MAIFSAILGAVFVFVLFVYRKIVGARKPTKAELDIAKRKIPKRFTPTKVLTGRTGHRYLVIGGSGMLGSHIVEALLARGETDVAVFDRTATNIFEDDDRVTMITGDICKLEDVVKACRGRETVICTAAVINYYSDLTWDMAPSYQVNVNGTLNVLKACTQEKVRRLIYTSTDTVCTTYDPAKKEVVVTGNDESAPYGTNFSCHYIPTKIAAEKAVLAANGKNGLQVVAMRPSGMWGPRDRLLTELFLDPVVRGIGRADASQDFAYVENVVHGFLCAERNLLSSNPTAAGKAYNIGNDSFLSYLEYNNRMAAGFGSVFQLLPTPVVTILAHISRLLAMFLENRYTHDLRMVTPQCLAIARATFEFSCARARKELGWEPPFTIDEGIALTRDHYYPEKLEKNRRKGVTK